MSATKTNNGSRAKQVSKDAPAVEAMFKTTPCRTYANKGKCRYQFMCMYAHGPDELRTKEMNIREDITTAEKVKKFQKRLETAYYTRSRAAGRTAPKQEERDSSTLLSVPSIAEPCVPYTMISVSSALPSVPSTPGSLSPRHLSPKHQSSGHSGFGSPGALFANFSPSSRTASMMSGRSFASASPCSSYWRSTTEPPVRLEGLQSSNPAMQPEFSGHVPRCDCRECLMATARAAQAQAVACPCPECLAAAAAAVAAVEAVMACRIVAARKAQAQVQVCPCLECLAAAQAALAAAAKPCPCHECNAGGERSAGDRTSAMSPSSASPGVSDCDYLDLHCVLTADL